MVSAILFFVAPSVFPRALFRARMDSDCFYSRGDPLFRPQGLRIGFSPVARQREDPPYVEHSDVGLGQKIDQIVYLVRQQAQETALIKEELFSLRADMKELQDTSSRLSESVSSTPSSLSGSSASSACQRQKIPTQLLVRELLCPVRMLDIIDTGSCESSS